MQERGVPAPTVRYIATVLRKAMGDAVRAGRLPRNPAALAERPKGTAAPVTAAQRSWTADELSRFLDHVRGDYLSTAWVVLATTGLRRGELLGLRWPAVDLERGRLAIRQTRIAIGYQVIDGEPKTARSRRTVTLGPTALAALRAHRKAQAEERLAAGPAWADADGMVFTMPGGHPIHPDRMTKMFDSHVRRAGLRRIRLHDLRHSFASLSLSANVHPKVVSEALGHSSIALTLDVYSDVLPGMQEAAAERFDALLGERS